MNLKIKNHLKSQSTDQKPKAESLSSLKPFLLSLSLILMVWFVFGQTLNFDFVNYDDNEYITENALVLGGVSWESIAQALKSDYSFYHPLTTLSHMLDFEIYGLNPAGFHFTNVVLHTMSAVILFLVLRSMTGSLWKSCMVAAIFAIHPLRAESVAWVTERKDCLSGFFFMLTLAAYHRYVKGRRSKIEEGELSADYADGRRLKSSPQRTQRNTEGSRFFLCVPLCTLAKRVVNRCFKSSMFNYCLVFVCMAACMLSKATVVTLPFVLLLLDYWPLRRFGVGGLRTEGCIAGVSPARADEGGEGGLTAKERKEHKEDISSQKHKDRRGFSFFRSIRSFAANCSNVWKKEPPATSNQQPYFFVLEKIPFFLLSAAMAVVMVLSSEESILSVERIPLHWRLSNAVVSYVTYIGQLFVPVNLAVLYPYPTETIPFWKSGGSILLLGAVTLFIVRAVCKSSASLSPKSEIGNPQSAMLTGWLWFLGMLIPMIGIMQAGVQAHADRYTYLSHIGLVILVTWGVARVFSKQNVKKALVVAISLVILFSTMLQARSQVWVWRSSFPLFTSTLESTTKNFAILGAMGVEFMDHGEVVAAINCYERAIGFNPHFVQAQYNLGNAYVAVGRFEDAIQQYQTSLALNPDLLQACYNLGICFLKIGKEKDAVLEYETLIQKDPAHQLALQKLAWVLATSPEEMIRDGERAIQLALRAMQLSTKQNCEGLEAMAAACAEVGDFARAIEFQKEAIFIMKDLEDRNVYDRLVLYRKGMPFRR